MNVEQFEAWVQNLERMGEADSPMDFGPYIMTPHQMLQHARANDATWQEASRYL